MTNLCVRCGERVSSKQIKEVLTVGGDALVVHTEARICENERCEEGYLYSGQWEALDRIENRLKRGDMDGFEPLGNYYEIELPESAWSDADVAVAAIAASG